MSTMDKYAPKTTGMRDPRDSKKKNGMFWNWPRFLKFGGAPHAPMQDGSKGPNLAPRAGSNASGPISNRG